MEQRCTHNEAFAARSHRVQPGSVLEEPFQRWAGSSVAAHKKMSRWQSDERDAAELEEEDGEDELEGEWELDPNDPSHPDYDLSESAGYTAWEPSPKPVFLRRGMVLLLTILVILGLLIPLLVRITY